jgi:ABC-type uncharacterized transport system auxiliary subunit
MKSVYILLFSFSVLFISGCSILPESISAAVNYYEISSPERLQPTINDLEIGKFTVTGPYEKRMVFKSGKNQLQFDEFNRWAQNPEQMLKRFFTILIPQTEVKPTRILSAEILEFACDLDSQKALLCVTISITEKETGKFILTQTFNIKAPMKEKRASSFAAAMNQAVKSVADIITKPITK